jgi:deoxyribonuclease-4
MALGSCIDTAHCYEAGFDVSTAEGLEAALARIEQTIGLDAVHVIHTNDSRTALGSRADRHEHIGKGGIGLEGFRRILNHPRLKDKPFILETPIEEEGDDIRNLEAVRKLCGTGAGLRAADAGRRREAAARRRIT